MSMDHEDTGGFKKGMGSRELDFYTKLKEMGKVQYVVMRGGGHERIGHIVT